jgi:predicted permease
MRSFADNLRSAARSLSKAPLFTTVAVTSLGLALALNTTMFALADAVLHPHDPYPHSERIIFPSVFGGDPKRALGLDIRLQAVREGLHSYDMLAAYKFIRGALVQTSSATEYHSAVGVSPEFFELLGVRPQLGRAFDRSDAGARATQGAVISFRLWNRLFQARPLSKNLTMTVARTRYAIIGVMPRGVHLPYGETDIWLPLDALPVDPATQPIGPFPILRLRPGATVDMLRAELMAVAARLTAEYSPKRPLSARVNVVGVYAGPLVYPSFVVVTVTMVLIIACANLATMLVARGMARRRDTAIRVALGASRRAIVRDVLGECVLIGIGGVTLGILLTWWALYVLPHFTIPIVAQLGDLMPVPSWRVFCFAFATSAVTILCAGALPAWRAATTDPAEPMKEGSASTTARLRDRYNPLIVLEVALSTALLVCSGLFVVVVVKLAAFDFRYAAKQLLIANIPPNKAVAKGTESRFYDDLVIRMTRLTHARFAATRHDGTPDGKIIIAEEGKSGNTWLNSNGYLVVSPDYFRTTGVPILRGRDFAPGDARGSLPVVIVDEMAAARLWPDIHDPVGRMIKLGRNESPAPWLRVIGVAQSIEYMPRRDIDLPPEPLVYVAEANDSVIARELLVRGDGLDGDRGRAALAIAVQQQIRDALAAAWEVPVRPWLDNYERQRDAVGFFAWLFGAFAGFGVVLCAVGLYGVLAYTVSRRLREFAVRIALGARRRDVIRLVLHDAAVTALAGVGIGAFVALWLTRPIVDGMAFVEYGAAYALVGAELLLFAVAFIASLGPVRQAAQADPVEVLRST